MVEDWARQLGRWVPRVCGIPVFDHKGLLPIPHYPFLIPIPRRACPIWRARTRQNPRNPESDLDANQMTLD